jgi:hypothetical protein
MNILDEILECIRQLPEKYCKELNRQMSVEGLNVKEKVWALEYLASADAKRAGNRSSTLCKNISCRMNVEKVRSYVEGKLKYMEELCELKAEYVREYIRCVLELCPTDFFEMAPTGEWYIDPVRFATLPSNIRRLVEGLELKYVAGRKVFVVKFVSKAAALALAARYTLTQKVDATVTVLPWDEIGGAVGRKVIDDVEEKIRQLENKKNGDNNFH